MSSKKWHKVGEIGVDVGLCWVGDPCYVLHKAVKERPKSLGKNWLDFCGKLDGAATEFTYNWGHPGLGVCVSTGYGDGTYPVMVRYEDGRIAEVKVVFIGEEGEGE